MSPRSLVSALDFLTHARGAQRGRRRQKPRGRGTKAVAPLGGERLEPRLALAVNFAGPGGASAVSASVTPEAPEPINPVTVRGVYVRGSAWNPSYLARTPFTTLDGAALGWQLPDGANQLTNASNVSWINVDVVSVRFDQPIAQPTADALQLVLGTAGGNQTIVPTAAPTLLAGGTVAQWTLPAAIGSGRYVISIASAGITSAAGTAELDGEWTSSTSTFAEGSGDGTAGGSFNFFFNALVGDVNGNGWMSPADISTIRSSMTSAFTTALEFDNSNYRFDINGSNGLNFVDLSQTRNQLTSVFGTSLASLPAVTAPTFPLAPTGLAGTSASDSAISLSWADVAGESEYRIERSDGGGYYGSYATWTEAGRVTADSTTFTDAGLEEGSAFSYRVIAVNAAGASPPGDVVAVMTKLRAPDGVVATGIDGGRIDLTWTDRSNREDYYRVEQFVPEWNTWTWVSDTPLGSTGMIVSGSFLPSTTYQFRVRATGYTGWPLYQFLASDDVLVSVTTAAFPSAPTGLAGPSASDSAISLSWADVAGESEYRIERSDGGGYYGSYATWTEAGRVTADSTTFTDAGLEEGSAFSYRVIAVNAAGASAPSDVVTVTTKLRAPDGVAATGIDGGRIDLTWTDRSNREDYYSVEQFVPEWDAWTWVSGTPLGSTGMIVSGSFLPSTTYQFRVRAESSSWWYGQGTSSDDVLVSVTTAAFPSAPGEVTAIAFDSDGVRLSWEFRPDVTVVVERTSHGRAWATVAEITPAVSSYEDYGLEPSTAYAYRIAFRNAHGSSEFSPTVSAVTPAGPRVAAAYRTPSVVFVGWTSPPLLEAATGIVIERATSGSDAWTAIATLAGNATSYSDTAVVPGTSYRYRISFARGGRPPLTATGVETGPEPRDSDGDGLSDGDELAGGTNPKAFSSDDDMLGDGFELENGLDPFTGDEDGNGVLDQHDDFDGDGLTNFREMLYGTSTRRTDTNGDGIPDGRDTDGDGVSDGVEVDQGSDPTNPLDQGIPADPEERIKLTLTVGDQSGSHSEQWALQVGTLIQESPDYGLVGSGEFSFDVGRSYPVTLRHRGSLNPDYPDYDWWADIHATDRSDFFVVDTNSPLYLVGPYQGDWMSEEGDGGFRSLTATLHVPRFDMDVDSKNDSGFAEPDDNREEDRLERDARTGKLVGVGAADRVPLVVRLSANVAEAQPASTELYFDYDPKLFQLWKNSGTDRSPGNMIPAQAWVNADDIGLAPGGKGLVYVEALEGASAPVPLVTQTRITGTVGSWGGIHNDRTGFLSDTVHLWPVAVDLGGHGPVFVPLSEVPLGEAAIHGTVMFETGMILGQLVAFDEEHQASLVYSGSNSFLNVGAAGHVTVTDGPGLNAWFLQYGVGPLGARMTMPVFVTDGIATVASQFILNKKNNWIDQSEIYLLDSDGTAYSPQTSAALLQILENLRLNEKLIKTLIVKGHGGPGFIECGDDAQLVFHLGHILIGDTDATELLRDLTDGSTVINFRGCFTAQLADDVESILDGAKVYGSVSYALGIPGTVWAFGVYQSGQSHLLRAAQVLQ